MATIAAHLSVEALRDRYVSSADVMEARHFQTIWLLAKGHSVGEVAEMTSLGRRWIEQLVVPRAFISAPTPASPIRMSTSSSKPNGGSNTRSGTPAGWRLALSIREGEWPRDAF